MTWYYCICCTPTSLTVSRSLMLPDAGSPLAAQAASLNPPDMHPSLKKSGVPQLLAHVVELVQPVLNSCVDVIVLIASCTPMHSRLNVQRQIAPAGRFLGCVYSLIMLPCLLTFQLHCRCMPHLTPLNRQLAGDHTLITFC